jgi:hypothetical protein
MPHFDCNFATSRVQANNHQRLVLTFWMHFLPSSSSAFIERTRMLDSPGEAVSVADTVPVPPDSNTPEIKVQPADAILRFVPLKNNEQASTRKSSPVFGRLLRYVGRTAAVACLCGLAWAGGAYYPLGHSPLELMKPSRASEVQQSPEHDEAARAMVQMAEEIRALKASVESRVIARDAGVEDAKSRESVKNQLDPQTATATAIADLASRVDAKLSRVNEQLASIEQQLAALASREQPPHKRLAHPHDAFDPSRNPTAPGVPRPLGAR